MKQLAEGEAIVEVTVSHRDRDGTIIRRQKLTSTMLESSVLGPDRLVAEVARSLYTRLIDDRYPPMMQEGGET